MSTLKPSSNNKEVETVSSRVKNTKKEIELLKADLEKLINSGVGPVKTKPSEAPEPIIKPNVQVHHSPVVKKKPEVSQIKAEPKKDSLKKPKSYNVTAAREYIKKQKEKRSEQLKSQINVTDNKIDLKKQKLQELQKKTLELVTKNLQLKHERSKSRDKEAPVRPDKSSLNHDRFKNSQENGAKSQISRAKSQERVFRDKSRENLQKIRPNTQKSPTNSRERVAQVAPSQERSKAVASDRVSRTRTRPDKLQILSVSGRKIDTNLLYPSNLILKKTDPDVELEKTILPLFETKTNTDTNKIDLNKRIIEPPTRLEHSITIDACLKDSKETQTLNSAEPLWLKPPPVLPYPYNFINTVKRKLQYAINSPRNCVDVGVQNSEGGTPEIEAKSREEIKELLVKSAASYASHKCPNLDLKAVENLELKKSNEIVSKNLFVDYNSESDTSKNIPDISSESLGSSEPILSLHGLRNLKLQAPKLAASKSNSHIKTNSHEYPEWTHNSSSHNYSTDFSNESGSHSIKTIPGVQVSHDSSIKTVASEKPEPSQFLIPSNSLILSANQNSHKSATITDKFSLGEPLRFKSLLIEGQSSQSTVDSHSEAESTVSKLTSVSQIDGLVLKEPSITLSYRKGQIESSGTVTSNSRDSDKSGDKSSIGPKKEKLDVSKSRMKNITIRPAISANKDVNEIHLKFEAEVRLLSDFNESFKQFMAVEKAFENLKNKNDANVTMTKIMQNVDTQTSGLTKTKTSTNDVTTAENSPSDRQNPSINFSRGSDIIDELNESILSDNRKATKSLQNSSFSTDFDLSNLNRSSNTDISTEGETKIRLSLSNAENYNVKNCAGLSLNMFEQLIKDEDTRIQHLKAIIKIREQALLDRTKGELVWLEIQKKQLVETGKIEEASLLKKKQRGIILKHEQERNEIKKLKQMQKEASEERKNILKQQRNLIKSQLSTNKMLSKIKVKTPRERRSSGPLRVVQSCSESVHSETSISRRSSAVEDVLSITSHSVRVSEMESELDFSKEAGNSAPVSNAKRALSMREAALQKRRKAAEELLRWHRKLLDEEKKIAELEAAATSVVNRLPKDKERHKFGGKQLNQLWRNMTGRDDRKFAEDKVYAMSQLALERLCKCARQQASKSRKTSDSDSNANKTKTVRTEDYSSVFETESVREIISSQEEKTKISSISELIDNFSRIEDEISLLSRKSELDIISLEERSESSVLKTTTQNHLAEPEEARIEEIASKEATEISSEKEVTEDSKTSVEESSSPETVPTVEDREEIIYEKVAEEEHVTSAISEVPVSIVPTETVASKIETEEVSAEPSVPSELDTKESAETAVSSKDEAEEPTDVPEATASSKEESEDSAISSKEEPEIPPLALDEALESASKIEESLSKLNEQLSVEKKDEVLKTASQLEESLKKLSEKLAEESSEDLSTLNEVQSLDGSRSEETTPQKKSADQIDVKKRVSEILADASPHRGDKSPRVQDLYVTAYDVGGPNLPEFTEPFEDGRPLPTSIFGSEAEELWKKQLAIEQEIKQLEQQQKEQLPYVFMREIPNKPPPPYTPPSSLSSLPQSILPSSVKEVNEISDYSSKVLYKAYLNNTLEKVKFSENGFKLFSKVEVAKVCAEFVFNICRDLAREHYRQFERVEEPAWLTSTKKPQLTKIKPPDAVELDRIMNRKLRELFGFKTVQVTERAIVKWGRKKRDHVDEILVIESQEEESQWINLDRDELFVKDQITKDIMKMLIDETASVFTKILCKKNCVLG